MAGFARGALLVLVALSSAGALLFLAIARGGLPARTPLALIY